MTADGRYQAVLGAFPPYPSLIVGYIQYVAGNPNSLNFTALPNSFAFDTIGLVTYFTSNGSTWTATGSGGGSGTVTTFSAGTLSPLFTTAVATPGTTPALTFTLSTQTANTIFAGPTSGGAVVPTFRAMVNADIPTSLTPQVTRLGLGIAADASLALSCLKASSGAGAAVAIAQFNVTTSDPYIVMGTTTANDGGVLQFLRGGGGTFKFGVAGGTGDFRVDSAANCSCTGTFDSSGGFKVSGTAGVDGSFDATNTVTVTKGLVTNIA